KTELSVETIRRTVVEAGERRIRPCLATTATTLLALLPVLGSTGRGSDILVPMAIPAFGGMAVELLTMFLLPVLWCAREEWKFLLSPKPSQGAEETAD
ncbi:MAG: Cu(I)/Ag(I) efflux system membrane protein CusA/SilA, partial [Bacteroidia bacterium]